MKNQSTLLPKKKIWLSLLLFLAMAGLVYPLNLLLKQSDLSHMVILNLGTTILLLYQWKLVENHYVRFKNDFKECVFYLVLSLLVTSFWLQCFLWIEAPVPLALQQSLIRYGYARPVLFISYSFVQAFLWGFLYKILSDRFSSRLRIRFKLFLSAFVFALVSSLLFLTNSWIGNSLLILYQFGIGLMIAYSYHQTRTVIPSTLALTLLYFISLCLRYKH